MAEHHFQRTTCTNQIIAGCIPIKDTLQNGSIQRNDSEDGGMVYKFHCDKGFHLNGFTVIKCHEGQWNGSKPSCEPKGENFQSRYAVVDNSSSVYLVRKQSNNNDDI